MPGGFSGFLHNAPAIRVRSSARTTLRLRRLGVTSLFPERLVSTSDPSETNFR